MRILMVGPNMTPTQRPLAWLLERGHEVGFISYEDPYQHRPHPPGYQFFPFLDEKCHAWLQQATHLTDAQKEAPDFGVSLLARRLRRLAAEFLPDVIHIHGLERAAESCLRGRLRPLVISAWGGLNYLLQEDISRPPWHQERVRRVLAGSGAVIVEAPALAAALQPQTPCRVGLIPMGVNPQIFRAPTAAQRASWRRALQFPDAATVLLSPRGWAKTYCQHHIVTAYLQARPHFRRPAILALCQLRRSTHADAKTYYEEIMNQLEQAGVMSEVRLVPELRFEMMASLYGAADLVVNYPAQDAFPSTLIEAAACERHFLTAALPAYQGTFIARYGTLIPPAEVPALAAALVAAVNAEPAAYQAQIAAARQVIVNEYDAENSARKLLTLYREVLADA